jgi:hypothetical protein
MADVINEENKIILIVEDGSCVPSANCYVSLAYADEYMRNTGRTDWAAKTEDERKAFLINATKYIDRTYSQLGWKGQKKYHRKQSLCFPRVELFDKDGDEVIGIPEELKQAVCEAGYINTTVSSLFDIKDSAGTVKRQKVDVLEVEYYSQADSASGNYVSRYTILDSLLAGFYKKKGDYSRIKRAVHTDLLGGRI